MINEILKDAEQRMDKSLDSLKAELAKVRTGRAHPSLLEHVTVEYYGSDVSLSQAANIAIADSRTLTVTPWEKDMIAPIEKAIMTSDLGLNPATVGNVIRVPMPALNEERRKELVKVVRNEAENCRIALRNIRRDGITQFKDLLKEKEVTEDEARRAEDQVQKLIDRFSKDVDSVVADKEQSLLEI